VTHIGEIFKSAIIGEESNIDLDITMIKGCIRTSSYKITVKILEEFQYLWRNIHVSLSAFKYKNAVMTYGEFEAILKDNNFNIELTNGNRLTGTEEILKFLYELGFIGVILSNRNFNMLKMQHKQHFVFYSAFKPLDNLGSEAFRENSIIINPTFISAYNLKVENTDEILGIHTWEELKKIDGSLDYDYLNKAYLDAPSVLGAH